ncbi:MAG TPA: 3-phosphoshikimate 1-carboxyvinyltransferase, partial [Tepidisphaeraceae bacterium]|nr:3-phosphoshikimate 1-carboxyvinyltransferase [Tepidisphaeraceae bacterium]
ETPMLLFKRTQPSRTTACDLPAHPRNLLIMSDLTLTPFDHPFDRTITPPGSKSLTNRALVIAALANGVSELRNVLFADDTQICVDSLQRLGFVIEIEPDWKTLRVHGRGGEIPASKGELFCGNSGTTIRFITALCSLGRGSYVLDGVERMRQRPIGTLVDLLRHLGGRIEYLGQAGFPPIRVHADTLPGGLLKYGAVQSSQYLSAILMASPYTRHEVKIDLEPNQTSWPYAVMTMRLMDHFYHTPELIRDPDTHEPKQIIVPKGAYKATEYDVEPDASNASYFLAAAALHSGSKVTIQNLGKDSLQGDVGFADVLHKMGADLVFGKDFITVVGTDRLEGIEMNLADMPDTAQTLAVVALFAEGQTIIHGLHTLKVKETDRLAALQTELTKFGAKVEIESGDTLIINPPAYSKPAVVDTYDDHRMAMSFALVGTKIPGVTIRDTECTRKTYPNFFEDLARLR